MQNQRQAMRRRLGQPCGRNSPSWRCCFTRAGCRCCGSGGKSPEQIDAAIRQLVSSAITTDGEVIDVFTAAGLAKPDISILSDQFPSEVRGLKHKNVAAELLEKLLRDELKVRSKRNLVPSQPRCSSSMPPPAS
jgi:Domain of unknown function (DUF3387)